MAMLNNQMVYHLCFSDSPGPGHPPWSFQALFYCLDVDGHGRLSRRNVAFIDDWARPGEETCEEELLGDGGRPGGRRRPWKMEGFTMDLPWILPMKMLISGNLAMKNADCGGFVYLWKMLIWRDLTWITNGKNCNSPKYKVQGGAAVHEIGFLFDKFIS